jgi:hypothetical protein
MTDAMTCILDTGNEALVRALAKGKKLVAGRFRVGEDINFNPPRTGTNPMSQTVFVGGMDLISVKIIDKDTLRYSMTLPETAGNFNIGNVILDFLMDDDTYIPGIWWVSDVAIPKERFTDTTVGNRFIISFHEKFIDFAGAVAITVTPPVRASLPQYLNQGALVTAETTLYQQLVIQHHSIGRTPVFVTRRPQDNKYYATGYMQRLESPYFGAVHGGFMADGYNQYYGEWVWGGWFISPPSEYREVIDGGDFTDSVATASYIDSEW